MENNSSVLRTVNILKTKYNKLKNISYTLSHIDRTDIENSINYLYKAGYLHLRHTESKQPTSLADTDFELIEGKLTAKGIQLAGVIKDECVEV